MVVWRAGCEVGALSYSSMARTRLFTKSLLIRRVTASQLRMMFWRVKRQAVKKWPTDTGAHERAVSNLFFLRLVCPAILGPKLFGISEGACDVCMHARPRVVWHGVVWHAGV